MPQKHDITLKSSEKLIIRTDAVSKIDDIESERRALHEHIEIKCFYEGSSTLIIGTQTVFVEAGDVVVINPYELHSTIGDGNPQGKYHLFMVSPDYFDFTEALDLRAMLFARQESFTTVYKQNKQIFDILTKVACEHKNRLTAYDIAIRGLMTELFALFLREGVIKKDKRAFNKNILNSYQVIEPAMRYIRDNYSKQITVDELAGMCGVSKHYFCRLFKSVTDKTAMEHLRDYRLAVSETLLNETDKSIGEISELCGFENSNYFCRCYKAKHGIPPGKKRNSK